MLQYSPKIITDSLVMCLDASQNKSYPTDLPVKNGLALWLDAADDTTFSYSSGTSVSQWRDKSGNNRHFFQSTAGNQPSRSAVINSRKAIQFTAASSQYLRYNSTIINNTTGGSVFVVWRTAGETNAYSSILDNYHCGANALGAGFQIERNAASNAYYWGFQQSSCTNAGRNVSYPVSYSDNTTYIYSISKDSSNVTAFSNGASVTLESSPSATWVEDTKGWTIGCWGNGAETFGRFYNGQHCEVIIFNRGLSTTEVKQVHTYLGQKWGILNTDRSIIDLSGFNDNGLLGNGTTTAMPAFDFYNKGALRFDGTDDYLSVADNVALNPVTVTVSMWLKRNAYQSSICNFLRRNDRDAYALMATNNTDTVWFRVRNSLAAVVDATTTMPLNTWTNLVGTFDGSNVRVYKDGALANTTANTSAISYSGSTIGDLIIARDDIVSGRYAPINVGSTLIYSRALSAVEVAQNYEAQKSKFANTIVQQGLVLNLDASNPYSYAGAGAAWYDVSGNGYVSSLTNTQTYNSDNGGSINFNGSTESVSAGPNSNLFLADMTAEVWIKITAMSGDWVRIIGTGSDPRTFGLWYYVNGRILWQRTGSSAVNPDIFPATPVLTVGSWAHVAATTIGMSHVLYLNGVSIGTNPSAGGPWGNSNTAITIGYAGYHAYSNSNIASARLYTRGLSAAEILQNYNATKGRFGL